MDLLVLGTGTVQDSHRRPQRPGPVAQLQRMRQLLGARASDPWPRVQQTRRAPGHWDKRTPLYTGKPVPRTWHRRPFDRAAAGSRRRRDALRRERRLPRGSTMHRAARRVQLARVDPPSAIRPSGALVCEPTTIRSASPALGVDDRGAERRGQGLRRSAGRRRLGPSAETEIVSIAVAGAVRSPAGATADRHRAALEQVLRGAAGLDPARRGAVVRAEHDQRRALGSSASLPALAGRRVDHDVARDLRVLEPAAPSSSRRSASCWADLLAPRVVLAGVADVGQRQRRAGPASIRPSASASSSLVVPS